MAGSRVGDDRRTGAGGRPGSRAAAELGPVAWSRLEALQDEGQSLWDRFDTEVRQREWHPFVPADPGQVIEALLPLRAPGVRFLEWGSAMGVITIIADLLGFEAYGIEIDADLVAVARRLAERFESRARFAAGSFLPQGYVFRPRRRDRRMGTIGQGASGYVELRHPLEDFDVVFGYPWGGEEPVMHDVMRVHGGRGARFLMHGASGVEVYVGGRLQDPR